MAGIGDKGAPRRREKGLLAKKADEVRARKTSPVVLVQGAPAKAQKAKTGWWLDAELVDQIRDAVAALDARGMNLPSGEKLTSGSLMAPILTDGLAQLWDTYNDGEPFPECNGTSVAKKRRRKD